MSRVGPARALPGLALGLAGVIYASWLIGPLLNPAFGLLDGYASELAARDQPYHLVFGLGDLVVGALASATGVALARQARGWPRWAWWGLVAFGVATALDGTVSSMDCAPTADGRCARLAELGELSWRHQGHSVSSSVAIAGGIASLLALLMARRGRGASLRWGLAVAAVLLVGTAATLVEVAHPDLALGAWQRVQLLGLSGWLVYAGVVATRPDP
ncbi:DUF998 domain-containing protein [Micromonospora inositola]|uniref:DUF998 domain-containing protein n=1 Tax=Micromonospora inositola TaxID=47865 RepID=A0A1C5IJE9_9ACTN|nr:DUF998 domain-containing protein [Micromonospora inositola]SCG58159.1 Protein of unknown function [Micromonospora inositola]